MRKTNPNQKKSHPPGKLPVLGNPTSQNRPRQLSCLSASLQLQSQDIRAHLDLLEKIPRLCAELKSRLNTLSPPHLQSSSQCSPVGFPVGYVSLGGLGMESQCSPSKGGHQPTSRGRSPAAITWTVFLPIVPQILQ